ncbi:hypothetical protein NB703_003494 [Pantoea ananatis]|jgi:hypothetical protein|uniref:Uncharacterized protein n=1 Tax=Pantoea ananas TaxID=553 RepID=A0AAJ1FSM9_PANAN|nr:hypothetical protein [Pantoea ananatis]MCW0339104.1 hypothetical protein [Pantoea ananatis]MCW0345401.1 hypothetical protein [Pantoea ananatis]MCW0348324.1 hypothetical protein [Pantoea ananatis]MCW0355600.1 hypothetical protein [Pantoea ananatis]
MNRMFYQEPTLYKDVETQLLFTTCSLVQMYVFARLPAGFFIRETYPT